MCTLAVFYLMNKEVLSEKGCLLRGCLSAVIGQDLSKGCNSILWLTECERLTADCEVNMILCQRPASVFVHLHGLAVTA